MIPALDVAYLLFGLAAGYVHASFVESWCHDRIQHARRATLDRWGQYPLVGRHLRNAWKSHSVAHHGMSFGIDHVSQFASREHETRAHVYFQEHGLDPANDFGLTVTSTGFVRFLLPFMVINTTVAIVAPAIVSIPFALMSLISPILSKYVHPQLHRPYKQAIVTGPILVRLLLRSQVGRSLWIHHFLHHRRPGVCFNLMLPIGDWLRGVHSKANATDFVELERLEGPPLLNKSP